MSPGAGRVQLRGGLGRALVTVLGGGLIGGGLLCAGLLSLQLAPLALGAVLVLGALAATPGLRLPAFDAGGVWVARFPWSARALRPWSAVTAVQVVPRRLIAGRSAEVELRLLHAGGVTVVLLRDVDEGAAVAALIEAHVPAHVPGARALRGALPRAFSPGG